MNEQTLKKILEQSVKNLFDNQPNIFKFTSETGNTEWNLVHHLANEVYKFFPWFDFDLDVTKPNIGRKRPDIIFHRRGTHTSNFLVIELKRNENNKEEDIKKIKQVWFGSRLNYNFGAIININDDKKFYIKVFSNEYIVDR